ncbi:lysosomal alpha-glucosidase [Tribolium castaneum]|uniref:Lysosomal alpha-glucosidase-like Protein n=1 Tax=Tribolium castaneum TaxID=7070 RepID=D6WDN8_TRICA|nr:PREDICTED: lysosomal alpha-glucosidase [Tribolium castaneum]EEZ99945.2 Lysosomal alpha-glucosidase-like Protein [Tribolium castaneum]|eukprot:XP_969694.1 PREDICTED: lysosomal alpha-glucosidase [Tribolium castaneum]
MTRIRYLLQAFRSRRRNRHLSRTDSVSFEAFCNEIPPQKCPATKESSLNGDFNSSPLKRERLEEDYVRFAPQNCESTTCSRPSLPAILLVLMLLAVFLVLPLVYLLHCFGVIYTQERYEHPTLLEKIHHTHKSSETKVPTALPPPPKPDYGKCKLVQERDRFDCYPENGANQQGCEARGCCWIPAKKKPKMGVPLATPYCFYPSNYGTYNYVNVTQTAYGLEAFLKRGYATAYPGDVEIIKLSAKFETETRLHIKISDPLKNRFEPPFPEVPIVDKAAMNLSYLFYIDSTKPGFRVVRRSDNTIIFDALSLPNLIFSDQFLQLSGKLPSNYIYGIGEHRTRLLLSTQWSRFTLFNHDAIPSFEKNLYGSHPFYLIMENSTKSHGFYLQNSNAMDVILQPTPAITFRPIGGVLDFYFFLGPTPSDVISQYTDLIGRPFMPPYWGLGFHLCRFGYKTLNRTKLVMQRNIDAGIPLDTQWNDLDYMKSSNDFTYDSVNFKGLPQFVKDLHLKGMHYIPLIDAGVSGSEPPGSYPPFDEGLKMDIFVKNSSGKIFIGKVWNNKTTVWPDFTHPTTVDYWTMMLKSLHDIVPFDGAWIDMNEPSNFLSGSFNGCPKTSLDSPPYLPSVDGGALNYKTMCMSAKHYAGLHYNVHNLFGFTEAIVTSFAMSDIRGRRPMVISRSTFAGHGHYAGHWSGDVVSDWLDMRYTIPQLLSFSLFGVPLMGADICGFNGNTTRSLCNRWTQLGAFYPFSRNHNTDDGIDQDPVAMGPEVVMSARKALSMRYKLLPYLYTLFWAAHTRGDTVARPLFFEFPTDLKTYDIDTQFLWGPALMIVPVLEENSTEVTAYLPEGLWYDIYTKSPIAGQGQSVNLSAPLDTIPVLLRGGYILPTQAPEQTTTRSRLNRIEIVAAGDEQMNAFGEFYWDDGDSLNSYEEKQYTLIDFWMERGVLRSENIFWSGTENPPNLGAVTIVGITDSVEEVLVNNVAQAFRYDTIHKYLLIENLNVELQKPVVVTWK